MYNKDMMYYVLVITLATILFVGLMEMINGIQY
mgnify:CR=1 FL=1|jgi:hypothetical protein